VALSEGKRQSAGVVDPSLLSLARALRDALDPVLVAHGDGKTGLVLALLAREHAYLEGPPGCGKSALALAFARIAGARLMQASFHRDTSAVELLGSPRLRRQRRGNAERLAFELMPGPLATAEVLLLDDLSRAPGEALAPLLRILSERRAAGAALPLETAIATAGAADLESYADPLEPSQLDRFAVQIRMRGLVSGRRFERARTLLDRDGEPPLHAVLDTDQRHALQRAVAALTIEPAARAALLRAVERLRAAAGDEPALLSDRAFARAAPGILKAHAFLRGAERVEAIDVRALRFMLARRVPESLEPHVAAILEDALLEGAPVPAPPPSTRPAAAGESGRAADSPVPVPGLETVPAPIEGIAPQARARGDDDAASVENLIQALLGRLERGAVARGEDPGGQPRGWRRMRRLDELLDADPVDALLYAQGRSTAPRVYRRERRNAGGTLAVLRDVSASMEGRLSRWAGQVVAGLVRTGARRRMRMGYVEFNHEAERFEAGGAFFHRRYRRLLALASRRRAEGRTNYEAPLRSALAELRGTAGRERHVVLLTDGVPLLGDPSVRHERALARELGVKVHTVFLGLGECPEVLDEISRETRGSGFAARPRPDGRVTVIERATGPRSARGRSEQSGGEH
jgi:MoxR-like ATPase